MDKHFQTSETSFCDLFYELSEEAINEEQFQKRRVRNKLVYLHLKYCAKCRRAMDVQEFE